MNELLKLIEEKVLTEECIEHLKNFMESSKSSSSMELYYAQRWRTLIEINSSSFFKPIPKVDVIVDKNYEHDLKIRNSNLLTGIWQGM